jgi:ubiquinol-cytochrome c reductase core subunit 2
MSFNFWKGGLVTNVMQAAKQILEGKASVSAVGDLYALPFAEEIGLKV